MKNLITGVLLITFSFSGFSHFFEDKNDVTNFNGYFTFYYDESQDKLFLQVSKNQLEKEFLYVNALSEGIGSNDIGLDRGQLGDGVVVKFKRAGNKLLLVQPNQNYRAITNNKEEKQSVKEAFEKSVWSC